MLAALLDGPALKPAQVSPMSSSGRAGEIELGPLQTSTAISGRRSVSRLARGTHSEVASPRRAPRRSVEMRTHR